MGEEYLDITITYGQTRFCIARAVWDNGDLGYLREQVERMDLSAADAHSLQVGLILLALAVSQESYEQQLEKGEH